MTRSYRKRPESDTSLKNHNLSNAGWYDVTMVIELTRTVRVKALNEEQANFFAENRVRKKSKCLARHYKASIGDIHLILVEEDDNESAD